MLRFPRVVKDELGVGLTEVAVAIVVLGIVLVGLFPLVLNSLQLAAKNADVAQANRIVTAQLESARDTLAAAPCAAVTNQAIALSSSDAAKFQADRSVACPSTRLATVTVRVQTITTPVETLATATTRVVTAASTP